MKICLIGKFPPIEGGVSTTTFWLAHGLAKRGHQVFVVTNADEVESDYRMNLRPEDRASREPSFPESGGFVRVLDTERLSGRTTHIPAHNPFVTKLATLATQVIREQGCEAIFAYYFEPYGLAAHLASSWTGVPWVVRHAGSDLDRLMRMPQLSTAYKESLRRADAVVTRGRLADRFVGMGVSRERIFTADPYSPSHEIYHPDAEPMDVNGLAKRMEPKTEDGEPIPFDPSKPTIGIYGKVGLYKGSYDLLRALAILKEEGLDFNFLAMTQGRQFKRFERVLHHLELTDRTWVLPFQPNWRVPSFIHSCTAVCFLERDFPIKIHTPTIAIEVLTAGGCLILSQEIASKQRFRDEMEDGTNLFLVEDPKAHKDLAAKLRAVVTAPEKAPEIGRAGRRLVRDFDGFDRYVESWEEIIARAASHESPALSLAERARQDFAEEEVFDTVGLSRALPWAPRLLGDELEPTLQKFSANGSRPKDPKSWNEVSAAFCKHLAKMVESGDLNGRSSETEICLRFEDERRAAQRDDDASRRLAPFPDVDRLCGRPVTDQASRPLKPVGSAHTRVVRFPVDPTPWFFAGSHEEVPEHLESRETFVLFHRAPNLQSTELKISASTAGLLELCDGSRSTEAIVEAIVEGMDDETAEQRRGAVLAALQSLYEHRVLAFCS